MSILTPNNNNSQYHLIVKNGIKSDNDHKKAFSIVLYSTKGLFIKR